MSLRSQGCAPSAANRRGKTDGSGFDNPIPIGTVTSRLRQLGAFSNHPNSSFENPDSAERERVNTGADAPDFQTLPGSHIFVFHNYGRDRHGTDRAQKSGVQAPTPLQPLSCRKSFSIGHLCNKFGLTEIHSSTGQHVSNAIKETQFNPTRTHLPPPNNGEAQPFTNPLFLKVPQNLPLVSRSLRQTPDIERWRSARDIFTQYDISRPSGWLSDIEGLSLSGDGNASPRRYSRYCHICSVPTLAPTHCSSCGHRLCERCKCEVSSGTPQAHTDFSPHPSPTMVRDGSQYASTVEKQNHDHVDSQIHRPFNLRADTSWRKDEGRGKEKTLSEIHSPITSSHSDMSERQSGQIQAQSIRPIKKNPFVVKDNKDKGQGTGHDVSSHPLNQSECDNPMCKSTYTGHYPFRHSGSYSKYGSEQSIKALDPGGISNLPPKAANEKSDFSKNLVPGEGDVPHRHHSAGFHSYDHITEHLSSAIGHNAQDLLEGRIGKETGPISSKTSVKRSPYLQPLTKLKPITRVDSFQWTQDTVLPGHPGGDGRQQHSSMTEVAAITPNRQPHETSNKETTHTARHTTLEEATIATIPHEHKETLNGMNLSQRDNKTRRTRPISTPPWLRNPTKEAADATAQLHHVNTKSNVHTNGHKHTPNITVDDPRGHPTVRSTSPVRKAGTPGGHRLPPIRTHNSSSLVPEAPGPSHVTPKIQINQAPSEHTQRYSPVSVSKRRETFESVQDHQDTAFPAKNAGRIGKTLPRQEAKDMHLRSNTRLGQEENATPRPLDSHLRRPGTNKSFMSTTYNRSDQEFGPKYFAEQSSGPEIAKPTPIAPPNHECDWKEKYLVLATEIRQLKAEMSTRASLKSLDIPTPKHEERGNNLDILAATIILHSRDRDDIVINTDVSRDGGSRSRKKSSN
ncbi:hypothetical protein F4859DRAFT_510675 [Xylaria cf. heliscus]|nr:hypothetical protein F4859DRAFT_510675 [Xylaria cf. heliscus]